MDISQLGNPERQTAGVWVDFVGESGETIKLKIAAASNKRFREKYAQLYAAALKEKGTKTLETDALLEVDVRASIGTILVDWDGLTSGGAPFLFTDENAYLLLTRPTLEAEGLRSFILNKSATARTFVEEVKAADLAAIKSASDLGA